MASGVFGVALSGLNAAQIGLQTTGHNITNVNTPGFSRQQVLQTQAAGQFTGAGFMGHGVNVASVQRVYADYLISQSQGLQAQASELEAHAAEIGRLSDVLSDADMNLGAALDRFFSAAQALSAGPGDPVLRQSQLSAAQSLAGRFQALDATFSDMQARVDGQIRSSVELINGHSLSIARLNAAIADTRGGGQMPNDLLDQRDALIANLNKEVRAVVVPDGTINLFLTNGQALVLGSTAQKLVLSRDDLDPSRLTLGIYSGSSLQNFRQNEITGGILGGMLAFRDQTLLPVRNEIGRLAMTMASAINAQHRLGMDQNGQTGGDLFRVAEPLAAASARNTGNATLLASVSDYGALTAANYRVFFDGSAYIVTRLDDDLQSSFATLPQTLDGVSLSIGSGTPAAGDSFLVQPSRAGASAFAVAISNTAQIAAAAPIRTGSDAANAGDGVISAGVVTAIDPNLMHPVTITFTGPMTYDVSGAGTGNPSGLAYVAGADIQFNGWSASISGRPMPGDVFTVRSNAGGSGDNRNAVRLADLSHAVLTGGATPSAAYARLVGSIGAKAQEINLTQRVQTSLLDSANQAVASTSGINLDEEAANLLRYQQAYQAAGKVISVANSLFESLLQAVQ